MKAISMMQPYAWLFANGYLTIDDRTWPTHYRGPIAIHASRQVHEVYYEFLKKHTNWPLPPLDGFDKGCIVAVGDLTDCSAPRFSTERTPIRPILERSHFGASGHHGFVFENVVPIPRMAFRGNRGLFDLPTATRTKLHQLAEAARNPAAGEPSALELAHQGVPV